MRRFSILVLLSLVVLPLGRVDAASTQAPVWWNTQWKYRLLVEVIAASARGGINTAGFSLQEQSRFCRKDGGDLRVLDQHGRAVPSEATVAEDGQITVTFQVNASTLYAIYYGNANAKSEKRDWKRNLGGLWLETRPLSKRFYNWSELAEEVALNKEPFGRKPWRQIYDLQNPFGPNEMYLSIYEGTIFCPRTGTYQFATNSDDLSAVYISKFPNPVCYRDGGNPSENWSDGGHGHAIGTVELEAGVHRVRYWHAEVTGGQLARMGWRKPEDEVIVTIPPRAFITTLPAQILGRQEQGKPLSAYFDYEHLYNLKINNAPYVFPMFRLESCSGERFGQSACTYRWSFPDSEAAPDKREVFYEFLFDPRSPAVPDVKLSVVENGQSDSILRPIDIPKYPIEYMDLLMEVETGDPVVELKDEVPVKLFLKNNSRLPRTFELQTRVREGQEEKTARRSIGLPAAMKPGQDEWTTLVTQPPLSRENVYVTFSLWFQGIKLLERNVALLRTDKPLGGLRLDANQRLRDEEGRYATLRLADITRREVEPPIRQRPDFMRILVLDNGLADIGTARDDKRSYVSALDRLLAEQMTRLPAGKRLKYQIERVSLRVRGGYPPLERLCDISKIIAQKTPDVILLTTSPEDIVNNIPLDDFRANLTAVLDQIMTQTRALPILLTPPPLPHSTVISRRYARAVKLVGIRKTVPVVDLYSGFMLQEKWMELFSAGSGAGVSGTLRPNVQGQRLIARMIADRLIRTIEESPSKQF